MDIAYIVGEYPSRTETFVANEIAYMRQHFNLHLLSVESGKTGKDDTVTYCPALFSPEMIRAHINILVRHPLSYIAFLNHSLSLYKLNFFSVFSRAVFFYYRTKNMNIRHLHAHFANHPTHIARLLADRLKITYSFSAHAQDIYTKNPLLSDHCAMALFTITCSRYNQAHLQNLYPETTGRVHLNYHGIDTSQWEYLPNRQFSAKLLTVGRLVEKKGHSYLIDALNILNQQNFHFDLYIAGDGPYHRQLKALALQYDLCGHIHFLGWQTQAELQILYHDCSVLVQPSVVSDNGDRDGIPNVLMEGMASGIPVISTRVSGIEEVLGKDCGITVNEKDAEMLAQGILRIANDREFRLKITTNAHNYITGFDSAIHLEGLKKTFDHYLL